MFEPGNSVRQVKLSAGSLERGVKVSQLSVIEIDEDRAIGGPDGAGNGGVAGKRLDESLMGRNLVDDSLIHTRCRFAAWIAHCESAIF